MGIDAAAALLSATTSSPDCNCSDMEKGTETQRSKEEAGSKPYSSGAVIVNAVKLGARGSRGESTEINYIHIRVCT